MMKTKKILALLLTMALLFGSLSIAVSGTDSGQIKNVILMIGDGMGENHLNLAKQEGVQLFMEDNCDLRGQSKTRSLMEVTDSAAGATALSCGVRVINGTLGVYAMDPLGLFSTPVSLTEAAMASGMKTGIVTTDSTAGATPSGFSVHCISRSFEASISAQQIKTDIDLIWGDTCEALDTEAAEENGFAVITTKDEMDALTPGTRSFGQFSGNMWQLAVPEDDASPNLTEMTEKAISLLDNEDGFFLMVEGAHIDKHSHKTDDGVNYPEKVANAAEAVEEFDNAVEAAVSFAREDGETLVVVTADHETGAIELIDGTYTYTSGSHSGDNVPLMVFGSDSLIEDGAAIDNKDIPVRIANALGWDSNTFPASEDGVFLTLMQRIVMLLEGLESIQDLV